MTKTKLKAVLDRVLTWPPSRQADAAAILATMEVQDESGIHLSAEQVAEVRRRLANPSARRIPAAQVFKRIRASRA